MKIKDMELDRLVCMLDKENIPYEFNHTISKKLPMLNMYRIAYPSIEGIVCSAIQGNGSYGNEENLIEIKGLLTDEEMEIDTVLGYLTAEDVFSRIKTHWEMVKNGFTK